MQKKTCYLSFIPVLSLTVSQVLNTSVEVREGGDDQTVVVTSNFPPAVFCDINSNETCNIFFGFEVTDSAEDTRCPSNNETLPQLVLRWSDENSAVV